MELKHLADGLSKFSIKGNPVVSSGSKILPKYPLDCPLLCYWVFDNFILADDPFFKGSKLVY